MNHQWRGSHGALAGPIVLATTRIRSLASGERATTPMDAGVGGELGQLAGAYNDLVLGMTDLADRAGRVARGEAAVAGALVGGDGDEE